MIAMGSLHRATVFLAACVVLSGCDRSSPAPAPAPAPHYGEVMSSIGRRFELVGRAASAARWDLAAYELHELDELLDDDLPAAAPPKISNGTDLRALAGALAKTNVPELEGAVKARDAAAFKRAFASTAAACNGCHQSTGHAFIEIPAEPGAGVPKIDPLPAKP